MCPLHHFHIISMAAILIMLIGPRDSAAQACGTVPTPPPTNVWPWGRGVYLPSGAEPQFGPTPVELEVAVVLIEYPDDETPSVSWPQCSAPTLLMSDLIDPNKNSLSGKKYNFTTFALDISHGKWAVVGHPYYVQTRYPMHVYMNSNGIPPQIAMQAGHPEDANLNCSINPRYWATRHALQDLDATVNFASLDNWTIRNDRTLGPIVTRGPDGIVDMILACWRGDGKAYWTTEDNVHHVESIPEFDFTGINILGANSDPIDMWAPLYVDNGTARIEFVTPSQSEFRLSVGGEWVWHDKYGSGVTALRFGQYPKMFNTTMHELGHWLWTDGVHEYSPGTWGLMTSDGDGRVTTGDRTNSYEEYQYGWATVTTIASNQTLRLHDFASTGECAIYNVTSYPGPANLNEMIFFEYHALQPSRWVTRLPSDDIPPRPWSEPEDMQFKGYDRVDLKYGKGAGLYAIYSNVAASTEKPRHVLCADGRWTYTQSACTTYRNTSVIIPVWRASSIDRSGATDHRSLFEAWYTCDPIPVSRDPALILAYEDQYPELVQLITGAQFLRPSIHNDENSVIYRGDGKDAFTFAENPVFSPWSNPSSRVYGHSQSSFGFEITDEGVDGTGPYVDVQFYVQGAENASPSKPNMRNVAADDAGVPIVTWWPPQEPDVNCPGGKVQVWSRYEYFEPVYSDGDWVHVVDADASTTDHIHDSEVNARTGMQLRGLPDPELPLWFYTGIVWYRVRSEQPDGTVSVFSEPFPAYAGMWISGAGKRVVSSASANGVSIGVAPSAIQVSVASGRDDVVLISIFDYSGREVAHESGVGSLTRAVRTDTWASGAYYMLVQLNGNRIGGQVLTIVH